MSVSVEMVEMGMLTLRCADDDAKTKNVTILLIREARKVYYKEMRSYIPERVKRS
jgi:hypothetical protein